MSEPSKQEVIYLMNRAVRLLIRRADKRLSKLGFAVAQMPVLKALKKGQALNQKDLAALARIEQPAMAELLGRMERDGYIERLPNPNDRRSSLFVLTAPAQQRVAPARAVVARGHDEALAGFTQTEIHLFSTFMRRITLNLEASEVPEGG